MNPVAPHVDVPQPADTPGKTPHDQLFNVVILPTTPITAVPRLYQLSATRNDRARRLLSPHWSEPQLRAAFAAIGTPEFHLEQLLRGNRMVFGGRDTRKLFFTAEQLEAVGLTAAPETAFSSAG